MRVRGQEGTRARLWLREEGWVREGLGLVGEHK